MLRSVEKKHAAIQIDHELVDVPLRAFALHEGGVSATATGIAHAGGTADVTVHLDGDPAAVALFAALHGDAFDADALRGRAEAAGIAWREPVAMPDLPAPAPDDVARPAPPPGVPVPRAPLPYMDDPIAGMDRG